MAKPIQMTRSELLNLGQRAAANPSVIAMRDHPAERQKRGQKYGNTKVVDAKGRKFDSKAEHKRWQYLDLLQRTGEISGLQLQVPFVVIPELAKPRGGKERPTVYIADFVYQQGGEQVVEDVKGAVTPEFRLKRKLMLWVHGIEVQEVRS